MSEKTNTKLKGKKMKKLFLIVSILLFSVVSALAGICSGDSFDISVQKSMFANVAEIMGIVTDELPPAVLCGEDMTDKEFADAIGMTIWGNKRGNFFSWRLGVVILTSGRSMVHVLVHEFVHYFQFNNRWNKDATKWTETAEEEAVRIQNMFK